MEWNDMELRKNGMNWNEWNWMKTNEWMNEMELMNEWMNDWMKEGMCMN